MRRFLASLALLLTTTLGFTSAAAEEFPSRPIRLIVPTTAGDTSAELGRHIRLEHDKWAELIRAQKITAE